uniref:Mediator of RNA polymerase II transcription subunit 6 n=1 Tax=Caenorhabditis japonica TaxID=281687 RepID=A0A8R1I7M5_CAEJA
MIPRMGPPTARMENPLHVSFRNPQWPPNFINKENVLDYFCNQANAFYEMNSCNQQIRMQNITNRSVEDCLRTMQGIQYVVWYAQPPLFIICKQRRNSVQNVSPISYYYVINGSVHQAPDTFSLIQSRLLGALEPMRNAFQEVTNYARYNTAKGYYWEFKGKPATKKKDDSDEEEEKLEERSTNFQKTRTLMLLNQLFVEMPAYTALEKEEVDEEEDNKSTTLTTPAVVAPSGAASTPAAPAQKAAEPKFAQPAGRPVAKQ